MAERPILFSAPMVRALLDGRKTQTRRVVKPQPAPNAQHDGGTTWAYRPDEGRHVPYGTVGHLTVAEKSGLRCPYGIPGDRLWVRETWAVGAIFPLGAGKAEVHVAYASDEAVRPVLLAGDDLAAAHRWIRKPGMHPSIHMHRWASRLTLEVAAARVERLHAISERDCWAEGVSGGPPEFAQLWTDINGAESWGANPWVWVVEFRRIELRAS